MDRSGGCAAIARKSPCFDRRCRSSTHATRRWASRIQWGGVKWGWPSRMRTVQWRWWMVSWWCPQSRTRLVMVVGPPSAQCWMWWASVQPGGRSQPGNAQPWSRRVSARRSAVGMVRVARPMSRGSEEAPRTAGMSWASQASRRIVPGCRVCCCGPRTGRASRSWSRVMVTAMVGRPAPGRGCPVPAVVVVAARMTSIRASPRRCPGVRGSGPVLVEGRGAEPVSIRVVSCRAVTGSTRTPPHTTRPPGSGCSGTPRPAPGHAGRVRRGRG